MGGTSWVPVSTALNALLGSATFGYGSDEKLALEVKGFELAPLEPELGVELLLSSPPPQEASSRAEAAEMAKRPQGRV